MKESSAWTATPAREGPSTRAGERRRDGSGSGSFVFFVHFVIGCQDNVPTITNLSLQETGGCLEDGLFMPSNAMDKWKQCLCHNAVAGLGQKPNPGLDRRMLDGADSVLRLPAMVVNDHSKQFRSTRLSAQFKDAIKFRTSKSRD
ncbi:hypothetical protein E4U21_006667 [Claviceps maximensis]|nr:hypothetical protein E4U21_006667 [Claviceps maximensis]